MTFKVGAQVLTYGSTWDEALDVVRSLDEMGYSYIWGHDHLYSTGGDPYQGFFEGWTTLAAWAQATTRARLGLLVGANTFRNPGVVAKMAVTIDHASHGRSILGLGAGNVAFENIAHGIDPGKTMGQRMDWFEESLAMVVALLAGEEVTHHSEKYQFEKVRHAPRPMQARIPVVIGADGEKRGLKLAARYADIWQWFAPFDGVATFRHKDEVLRAHADAEGRDATTIERMLGAKLILRSDPDEAQRVAEELVAIHKWGPSVWDAVWATTPERAADRLVEFVEAGAHSFSPQIGWPYDRETIERLIGEVVPAVDARIPRVIVVPGLDLVLAGGSVIDGTGAPRRRADVGVTGGRIVAIGDLSAGPGTERIDATDRVVAPGWVDLHSHSDLTLLSDGRAISKVAQGVTTEVNGNCGMGGVPLPSAVADLTRAANATIDPDRGVSWEWRDLAGYVRALHDTGLAINTAPLIGHLTLRIAVAGEAARPLDDAERRALVAAIDACLDDGAAGVSTGLMFPPAMSADVDELVAIGRAVARRDRLFAIHMRNYSDDLLDAVTEALAVARASGCRLQISHLAVAGRRNWGKVPRALEMIEAARADGVDVGVDIYPYIAGSANLSQLLPGWAQDGGPAAIVERLSSAEERRKIREDWRASLFFGWDEVEVSSSEPGLEDTLGLTVEAVAERWSMDPNETALALIERSDNRVQMVAYGRSEDDLRAVLTHDLTSIGSDGLAMDPDGPSSAGRPHPRSFGCYPRLLGRYVREVGLLTLEQAIAMSTSRPADRAGLADRGRIVEGAVADLVVFDPETIIDAATFQEPTRRPVGIQEVVVAGRRVLAQGRQVDAVRPGRALLA